MGGMGSGRPKTRERELLENCQLLDIGFISSNYGCTFYPIYAFLKNEGDKEFLFLDYSINWFRLKLDYIDKMEIDKTDAYFGGQRKWIICNCGKRVRKLYRPESKTLFKCRICHDLMYQSQESNVYDGWLRKTANGYGLSPKKFEKKVFG